MKFAALFGTLVFALVACGSDRADNAPLSVGSATLSSSQRADAPSPRVSVLVFSKTAAFRHDSIPIAVEALKKVAMNRGWALTATEDTAYFTDTGLSAFNVVTFLSTTGDVLNATEQDVFEKFIRAGNGFAGIHSASDTEYDWPFYGELVGAYFKSHPAIQQAKIVVESDHATTRGLPNPWQREDEWYSFRTSPRASVSVLLSLDEQSYAPGDSAMGADHPIAWLHEYQGGRAFYTALGHTSESYADPQFLAHVSAGIEWAAGFE